jgi:hypothetical protein
MLKQVQHDIFLCFPLYITVSNGEREGVRGFGDKSKILRTLNSELKTNHGGFYGKRA